MSFKNALLSFTLLTSILVACSVSESGNDDGKQPAAEEPANDKPANEKPADEKPAGDKPADVKPVAQPPVVQDPVVQPPVVQDPVVQPPVAEDPVVQPPVVEDPQPPIAAQLLGEWTLGECSENSRAVLKMIFTESTAITAIVVYGSDCTVIDYRYDLSYSYRIDVTSAPFSYDTGSLMSLKISALTEAGAQALNDSCGEACEETPWKAGDSQEITLDPPKDFVTFDIFKIEDGKLYFGKTTDEEGNEIPDIKTSPDKRPTEFVHDAYTKSHS